MVDTVKSGFTGLLKSPKLRERQPKLKLHFVSSLKNEKFIPNGGKGYLAGEIPDGLTTLDDLPVSAEIRVVYRDPLKTKYDGAIVARTVSANNGTWRIDGLNPDYKYDVIASYSGKNDIIVSNVSPIAY